MASLDVIKEIPGYKVILKAVLRAQIQQLVEQLAVHTDEESVILTANISDGTLSHLGSDCGKMFLETYDDVKKTFLGFCLRRHHVKPAVGGQYQTNETVPELTLNLSSNSKFTKSHSKVLPKSRHSPYQSSRPQSNTSSGFKAGTGVIPKNKEETESKEEASSLNKTEDEHLSSESYMAVCVKQEPEDISDENSKSSVKENTNNKSKSSDEMAGSLNENVQLAEDSGLKSKLEENSEVADTSLDWADYSDSMNESAGQWADNSELLTDTTEQTGLYETFQGQNSSIVSTKTAEGTDTAVYFESKRGGTKMSFNGFVYNEDRRGKSRIYWRCVSRKCKEKGRKKGVKSPGVKNVVPQFPVCQFCSKTFNNKSNLIRHMRIHTGAKPYSCEICFKTFNQSTSKKKHMITHMAI